MFSDEQFVAVAREIENPILDGWENFAGLENVAVYRKYREGSGLYEYKVMGKMDGVEPSVCQAVYTDLTYRKVWDTYVKELVPICEDGKDGFYWESIFPFPMSNRDYTFVRDVKELDINGKHYWCILTRSEKFPSIPENSGVVRVDQLMQSVAITANSDKGTKAFMHYYDDPKGLIPTWVVNRATKSALPSYVELMNKACLEYEEYLQQKGLTANSS